MDWVRALPTMPHARSICRGRRCIHGPDRGGYRQCGGRVQRRQQRGDCAVQQPSAQRRALGQHWARRITDSNRHGYPWNDAVGRLSTMAIDPQDTNRIYVGALNAGVWRTTDGGNTWQPIADSLPTLSIAALALDPINHNRLYLVSARNGVFRSDDGGTSWSRSPPPISTPSCMAATCSSAPTILTGCSS